MRGVFVTGTGTGVGKSIVSAALCAAFAQQGQAVLASKPLLSGLDDAPVAPWPHDHELLSRVTGAPADEIAPLRFGPPVSPHLAARLEGVALSIDDLAAGIRARYERARGGDGTGGAPRAAVSGAGGAAARGAARVTASGAGRDPFVVVEGAGGLLVPITDGTEPETMAALARELELPLLIAAPPGLGTINHVQLTLEAARARGLGVAGIVLTPWPPAPSMIETDNRDFLERHAGAPVRALDLVSTPEPWALATAGLAAGLHRLV